jgi:hypothetical protein
VGRIAATGRPVGHHAQRRIGQFQFARQGGFRHTRHADDVGPVALHAVDLGRGLQPRALRGGIHRTIEHLLSGALCDVEHQPAHGLVVGLGEIDMDHGAVAARLESHLAAPGVVDDLVRHHQRARTQVVADAAHRGHRNHLCHARCLQGMDVGAVVHQVRRDGVAVAVARDKHHVLAADAAEGERARGFAIRRARHLAMRHVEVSQLRQAAATYDAEHKNP